MVPTPKLCMPTSAISSGVFRDFFSSDMLFLEFLRLRGFRLVSASQLPFGTKVVHSFDFESRYSMVFKNVFPIRNRILNHKFKKKNHIILTEINIRTWESTDGIQPIPHHCHFYIGSGRRHGGPHDPRLRLLIKYFGGVERMWAVWAANDVQFVIEDGNSAAPPGGDDGLWGLPSVLIGVVYLHGIQAVPGVATPNGIDQFVVGRHAGLITT